MPRHRAILALLLLAASTGLVVGQEGKPPKQPPAAEPQPASTGQEPAAAATAQEEIDVPAPPQEDRTPITSIVETWMRYVQDGEHRGYVHEKISLVPGRLHRYEYLHEGDLDVARVKESDEVDLVHWSWQATAQLTEAFDIYRLEAAGSQQGVQWRLEVRTVEDKQLWELTLSPTPENPNGELVRMEFPLDQTVGWNAELIFYKLRQRGDLSKPGKIPFPISGASGHLTNLTLRVEEPRLRTYLGKQAYVTPVTIENAPTESNMPVPLRVYVDKFGRVVEAVYQDETSHYVVCSGAVEARGGEQKLSARGRRDPFSKIGAMTRIGMGSKLGPSKGGDASSAIVVPPEKVGEKLKEIGVMIDELERLVKSSNPRAEQVYQRFLRYYQVLRRMCAGDPVKVNQLDAFKARAEQIYGGAERLVKRAHMLLEAIEDNYNALNEKGVEENLKQMRDLRLRSEFFQDERVVEMDRLIKAGDQKLTQTKVRIDLARKVLVLTGTVFKANVVTEDLDLRIVVPGATLDMREPVKVIHNLSYALINDKLYREGEEVDGQNVVIEKIQPHGVRVTYKGEVREVGLKKRDR
ncbi:MAG: hypothetical protein HYY16_11075 [Planctomycetes bacterium]|nr:hypothetical protein [Planctomycetota bacterium]